MDRRWRNQRAAASMNQQQREQAAAGAATASATISPTTNQQANSTAQPDLANSLPKSANFQQQRQQAQSVQLHTMRPTSTQLGPTSAPKQPFKSSLLASEQSPTNEQSALDMAQSAAARVTGSAAAAIAAAKFKMLRSNTLAAAFGCPTSNADQAVVADSANVAPLDMLAVRTRDERIVNTLSTTSSTINRNRLNLDAK